MKLSRKAEYALRAVRYLSGLPKGTLGSINEVAEAETVPREFLAKILQDLTAGGILVSYRGVTGGYGMAREPRKVSFLNVIEAIDGPLQLSMCTNPKGCVCKPSKKCGLRDFWKVQQKRTKTALEREHFGRYRTSRSRR